MFRTASCPLVEQQMFTGEAPQPPGNNDMPLAFKQLDLTDSSCCLLCSHSASCMLPLCSATCRLCSVSKPGSWRRVALQTQACLGLQGAGEFGFWRDTPSQASCREAGQGQQPCQPGAAGAQELAGKPYTVDYHGLFESKTWESDKAVPCAYLVMG